MRRFGDFEAADLVSQTGLVTVWAARKPPGTANQYVIKALNPYESLPDPERFERQRNRFLGGAAVQERLTRAGALFWAPVYQQGKTDQGAFYATDRFEQSLQYLIDGQVRLNGETLGTIVMSISSGLLELRQGCNRPHGNLKPTNILVRRRHASALANLALTDPLPDESIQPHHGAADLRRLGELIYVLAAMRPAPETSGWQVPAEEKWSHLGAGWRKWKSLCNQLLRAPAQPDGIRLEGVLRMAARLQRAPRIARRVKIAVCCVILCAIAVGVYKWETRTADPKMWWTVCAENISWIDKLRKTTSGIDQIEWKPVKEVIALANKQPINPNSTWPFPDPSKEPGVKVSTVEGLQNNIDKLRGYLTPDSSTKEGGWILLNEINKTAKHLPADSSLAKTMNNIVSAVRPPDHNKIKEIGEGAAINFADPKVYKNAEDKIKALGEECKNIGPNICRIVENAEALKALCKNITDLNESVEKLKISDREFSGIFDRTKRESDQHADNIAKIIYGRPVEWSGDELKRGSEVFSGFVKNTQKLEQAITDKLLNKKLLLENWAGLLKEAPDFGQLTAKIQAYAKSDADWLKEQRDKKFSESVGLNKKWIAIVNGYKPDGPPDFDLRAKIENDYQGLVRIDDRRKQIADIFPQALDQSWPDLRGLHIQAIEKSLNKIPQDNIATIDPNKIEELESLSKVSKQLKELIDTYQILRNDLEQVRLLSDEKISEAVIKYQTSRLALKHPDIQTYVFGPTSSLKKDFLTLDTRIELQKGIGNKQKQELIDLINSREFIECRYAAWLQLGKLDPPWPNAEEWDTENKAFIALLAEFTPKQNLNPDTLITLKKEGNRRIQVYHQNVAGNLRTSSSDLNNLVNKPKNKPKPAKDEPPYPGLVWFCENWDRIIQDYDKTARKTILDNEDRNMLWTNLNESRAKADSILPAAERLKDFLRSPNWNDTVTYDRDLFMRDVVKTGDPILLQWPQTLIDQYTQYKNLPDFWSEVDKQLKTLYDDIQKEKPDNKAGEEYTLAEKDLKNYINKVDNDNKYNKQFELIEINRTFLAGKRDDLGVRIVNIRDLLRPEFCRNLKLEGNKVVFDIPALSQFEPILFSGPDETLPWAKKKDMWLSLGPKAWSFIKEQNGTRELNTQINQWQLSTENVIPEDKEKARWISMKDINTQTLHEMFFWKFTGNVKELHWPKYIRSIKDSTVILRYIPAGPNTNHFYMSVREITAQQYEIFLNSERRSATSVTRGLSLNVTSKSDIWIDWKSDIRELLLPLILISNVSGGKQFQVREGLFAERPMIYLTYMGADAYAKWLADNDGSLPTEAQHRFACECQDNRLLPWADEKDITTYANIGGNVWKNDVDNYNRQKTTGTATEPYGVIRPKDFKSPQELNIEIYDIDQSRVFDLTEPKNTQRSKKEAAYGPKNTIAKANSWGLHDMIGNVWEWCSGGAICGYSCLTPKPLIDDPDKYYCLNKNTPLPNNYILNIKSSGESETMIAPDYDIGFRIVINIPSPISKSGH